jgi:hypothetical protein
MLTYSHHKMWYSLMLVEMKWNTKSTYHQSQEKRLEQVPMIICLSLNVKLSCPGPVELAKENSLPGP